jgi:hypothetical protein
VDIDLKDLRIYRKLRPVAGPSPLAVLLLTAALAQAGAPVADVPFATEAPLRAEVDGLVAAASAARRLPFRGPLAVHAVGRGAIRGEVASAVAAGTPSSGPAAEEPFLRRLRLLPRTTDYARQLVDAYAAAPIPIYDPRTKRLLVPDFAPLAEVKPLLPHEIAHALTDQRFGIYRLLQIGPDGSHRLVGDAERARLAIVEGDATLTTLEVADPRETFLDPHALVGLAANLRQAITPTGKATWTTTLSDFAHVDGLLFTARVRARQTWRAVDRLWEDPPASTEQILHPEKYDACEEPVQVDESLLPRLPGLGRPSSTAVLGELVIRSWLASALPPELAERAAAGWGGDRAGVYTAEPAARGPTDGQGSSTGAEGSPDGGAPAAAEPALAWLTVWDDAVEAEDFARAAESAGVKDLARRGEAVALLFGVVDDPPAALSDMLDAWRRQAAKRSKTRRGPVPARCASDGGKATRRPAR